MSWQKDLKDEARKILNYVQDLEAKNKFLRDELAKISVGITFTVDVEYDFTTQIRLRAAKALGTEGAMKNRSDIRRWF